MARVPKVFLANVRGIKGGDNWAFPKFGPTSYPVLKVGAGNICELSMGLLDAPRVWFSGHGRAVTESSGEALLNRIGLGELNSIVPPRTIEDFRERSDKKACTSGRRRMARGLDVVWLPEPVHIARYAMLQQMGGPSRQPATQTRLSLRPKRQTRSDVASPDGCGRRGAAASKGVPKETIAVRSQSPSAPRGHPMQNDVDDVASGATLDRPGSIVAGDFDNAVLEYMGADAIAEKYCKKEFLVEAMANGKQGCCRYNLQRTANSIGKKGCQVASNRIKQFVVDHMEVEKMSPHDAHKHSVPVLRGAFRMSDSNGIDPSRGRLGAPRSVGSSRVAVERHLDRC